MRLEFVIITLGIVLSFLASVAPHFSGAYQMHFGVLVTHLVPYLVYGPVVYRLKRPVTILAGAVLLGAHGVLVVYERFLQGADYSGFLIYAVPLTLAILLLPLFLRAARRPW